MLFNAVCYGLAPLSVALAYRDGASPWTVVLVRFVFGMLSVWLIVYLFRSFQPLPLKPRLILVGWGGLLQAAVTSLTFTAFKYADVSFVMLLFYTYPVMVTIAAHWIEADRWSFERLLAVILAVGGAALLLQTSISNIHPLGIVLPLGAAVANTTYVFTGRRATRNIPPLLVLAYVFTGAAIFTLTLGPVMGQWAAPQGTAGWLAIGSVVLFPTVLGALAFFAALSLLGSSQVAIIGMLELVVAVGTAALWLDEKLVGLQVIGAILVMLSVAFSQIELRYIQVLRKGSSQ